MVRLDMSEYQERHTVSRMVGAPPGYVGYEEGGQLTEIVRRKPFSVILLDEIEKAHRDVFNLLLQILEDGRLTSGQGRTVDFKNTIIIMTSNIGSELFYEEDEGGIKFAREAKPDNSSYGEIEEEIHKKLRKTFRPEFLNRLDEIIIFKPLRSSEIRKIVDLELAKVSKRLAEQELSLEVSPKAREYLAKKGFNPEFGARPLRRVIQREIENPVSELIISKKLKAGDTIKIEVEKGKLKIS